MRFLSTRAAMLMALAASAPAAANTIDVNGTPRSYVLAAPVTASKSPLVLVLHGHGRTGAEVAEYTRWDRHALDHKIVAAFPDAIAGSWQLGTAITAPASNPDIAFLSKLIAKLVANGTADPKRVYITGLSQGGAMAYSMVCAKAQLFAASALVITGAVVGFDLVCRPKVPVPTLMLNGTADTQVPYQGGRGNAPITSKVNLMPTSAFVEFWRKVNGCNPGNAGEVALPNLDTKDGTTVTQIRSSCPSGWDVELYRVNGGGHQQPARPASLGSNVATSTFGLQITTSTVPR